MRKTPSLLVVALALALCARGDDKSAAFVLHVTHVKTEDVGDKPVPHDCAKMPCVVLSITAEAQSDRISYVLECKQWVLTSQPMQVGKCWGLEAGKEYSVRRDGRNLLFYDDKPEKDPLYTVIEETERKSK
jgi:hypothetical protein